MGHTVSDAAARSVRKSEAIKLAERTPEQILADIRSELAERRAVTPNDVRFLLAEFDAATAKLALADATIQNLMDKNEEFRQVYEMENSSQTIKFERVPIAVPTESGE